MLVPSSRRHNSDRQERRERRSRLGVERAEATHRGVQHPDYGEYTAVGIDRREEKRGALTWKLERCRIASEIARDLGEPTTKRAPRRSCGGRLPLADQALAAPRAGDEFQHVAVNRGREDH